MPVVTFEDGLSDEARAAASGAGAPLVVDGRRHDCGAIGAHKALGTVHISADAIDDAGLVIRAS